MAARLVAKGGVGVRGELAWGRSTWQVVDVASVHQEMAVFGVAQRGQVPGQGHAGPDVAP